MIIFLLGRRVTGHDVETGMVESGDETRGKLLGLAGCGTLRSRPLDLALIRCGDSSQFQ